MDTGLKYEGEAARKRFVVYWLRPALAALGFGLFTFLVISVPSEKEKVELRGEVHRLRAENDGAQQRLRDMLPFADLGRATSLTTVPLGIPGDENGWGRVLFDDSSGRGIVVVSDLDANGQRGFCWWFDLERKRHPLAAIDLVDGAGYSVIQLGPERTGSFLVTLEPLEGEPTGSGPVLLEAAIY